MGLRSSRLRSFKKNEEVNPLEGVVNIVDAMLVFACGLMLSLIINWNVDVGNPSKVENNKGQEVSLVQKDQNKTKQNQSREETSSYEKIGTVYKDPSTGKLYIMEDN